MSDTNAKLRGWMAENKMSYATFAAEIGMPYDTFKVKMLGKTDWSSCVITDTGIRMRDFGGKEIQSGETDLFSEWRRPPYTNMQRTGIKEILLENRAQLIIIALLSVILIFEIISLLTHSVR